MNKNKLAALVTCILLVAMFVAGCDTATRANQDTKTPSERARLKIVLSKEGLGQEAEGGVHRLPPVPC
jgi:hypothetical protein